MAKNKIKIRNILRDDFKEIVSIENRSYLTPWDVNILEEIYSNKSMVSRTIVLDKKIIGYNFYVVNDKYFQIINMTIDTEYQRNKYGTNLLADMFKTDNINTKNRYIDAWVNERYTPMLQFLKTNGFKAIMIAKGLFINNEDGILMRFSIIDDTNIPPEYEEMLKEFDCIIF